ncbi:uncharacterized protein [Diabrotica undecimpunctata]|uniref:uncharacterized protein n=1 Tax=Diabrotica undecimpunctata TaxID=50387 RepID=UPI003B6335B1
MGHNWSSRGKKKRERVQNTRVRNVLYYKEREEQSLDGVGFLISKKYAHKVEQFLGISERIEMIRLNVNENISLKIIQVYAPTAAHPDEEIDEFYEKIAETSTNYHSTYTMIIGDFNAKIGNDLKKPKTIALELETTEKKPWLTSYKPINTMQHIL